MLTLLVLKANYPAFCVLFVLGIFIQKGRVFPSRAQAPTTVLEDRMVVVEDDCVCVNCVFPMLQLLHSFWQ